ncbi:PREDICTED: uncharacterized protein C11orf74 homolog [Chrysochloris asiatica]|uniref:Uncharacterized protein C11orf74 homolog n=1 Tax=Chrysochloris asiatica TaxID=185453 RepID=A0A9B0WRW1_CHRAS|nr:PREDICTED: uncharacterized protein C11orf74 homolog [Chrysochloris asiatica]
MPVQTAGLEVMDEDGLIEEVLDKFVKCHEQTYEEFLSTFTHLSKVDIGTQKRAFGTDSSEKVFASVKFTCKPEPNDFHLRNKPIFRRTSSQCPEEEQIVMNENWRVDSSFQGDLSRAGKLKVDNFLDLEDLNIEDIKPQISNDLLLLLPGEVEQDMRDDAPSCMPSAGQLLTPEVMPRTTTSGAGKPMEECLGDEVQPFSLDEEFDYDNVTLTPKFTSAEINTIKQLSQKKNENTNTDLEGPQN